MRIYGAGRTDAGVHAKGQVAVFESSSTLSPSTFIKALNFYLPPDIAIKDACEVRTDFDPRRNALSREYRYVILNSFARSPLSHRWAYLVHKKLDIEAMDRASRILEGEHDFASFTGGEGRLQNTVRTVLKANVHKASEFIFFDITANAFLPQQVRRMVSCLIDIGSGKMSIEEFHNMLNFGNIGEVRMVAPAHGLCLMKVNYRDLRFANHEDI